MNIVETCTKGGKLLGERGLTLLKWVPRERNCLEKRYNIAETSIEGRKLLGKWV